MRFSMFRRALPVFLASAALAQAAQACSGSPIIGQTCLMATNFCPVSYLPADGRLLNIAEYSAVFALLGITYGGDGYQTFALPDLRGRIPVGVGQGPSLLPVVQGEEFGAEDAALDYSTMPSHSHSADFANGRAFNVRIAASTNRTGNARIPSNTHNYLSASPTGPTSAAIWSSSAATVPLGGVSIANPANTAITLGINGSGQPFPTVPPSLGLLWCIAVEGIFPSRQ